MFFVTDMDVDDVSYRKVVEDLTELYGKKIAPLHFPIREDGKFVGYVNVVKQAGEDILTKQARSLAMFRNIWKNTLRNIMKL